MPFEPGVSGNPGGRPKVVAEVRALARQHTVKAVETLAIIMADSDEDGRTRVAAAVALLERGYGKPEQAVSVESQGRLPVAVQIVTPLTKHDVAANA